MHVEMNGMYRDFRYIKSNYNKYDLIYSCICYILLKEINEFCYCLKRRYWNDGKRKREKLGILVWNIFMEV